MILVDTSVWINYLKGVKSVETDTLDLILQDELIVMGDLIYCELLQGFKQDRDFLTVKALLDNIRRVELVGFDIAEKAAGNFRMLRQKGITIRKTIDVLIATFCIENNVRLLHCDRDFDQMIPHLPLKTLS